MDRNLHKSVFARSLLLQGCWSFEGMQNLGFLMGLEPLLRRAHPAPVDFRAAVMRHLGYFNTQPYMVGFVLGAVGRMEERRPAMGEQELQDFDRRMAGIKASLSSALAAMGDSFFWGALRPACAAWTMLAWLMFWTWGVPHPVFWGSVFYLTVFNTPALWVRWNGVRMGYERGDSLIEALAGFRWQQKVRWVRRAGLAAVALLAAGSVLVPPWGGAIGWTNIAVFAGALGFRAAGWSSPRILAGATALGWVGALGGL